MIHSISSWNLARSPNYKTNTDLLYPYSEVPYIGNYKLVRLPLPDDNFVDHVDYWGEGRINIKAGSSGYINCYNVNHQYQLVSNGPDRDKKIPNRIPVISYTNCNTSGYIKDNSVKLVTLMGAPINKSCADDIARIVNSREGKVIVYGFKSDAPDIRNLDAALKEKGLYTCDRYNLNMLLKSITLFDENDYRAYINVTDLGEELYNNVLDNKIEDAVNIANTLKNNENGSKIVEIVNKLLENENKNIMEFAFNLWNTDNRDIITNYFPIAFKLIFNKDFVKIINKYNMFSLRVDETEDSIKERIVLGDRKDKASVNVRWEVIPVYESNSLYFKIMDMEYGTLLRLADNEGDKKAKASSNDDSKAHWLLVPIKVDDDILFYILNKEYNQGLKLSDASDEYENKQLFGHNGSVRGHPELYGWFIAPW
ncbi:microvitellogenin-like [Hyposmocoma kahamanoa]|uniref:microvitellogenin-like n=1 Tax=Hyposmocoma kahamanoa TaxID=1477025 RepID=UPI000E6D9E8E|nr:microvitellogenin-like [Hyposmocoma kahamanoa]XP_026314181.1 microvitellogenin-like [Hyposmocoma kahamanoa]